MRTKEERAKERRDRDFRFERKLHQASREADEARKRANEERFFFKKDDRDFARFPDITERYGK